LISVTLLNCGNGRSGLRVARTDERVRDLVDREIVRGEMPAEIADVAGFDDEAARQLVLQVQVDLIRRGGDLVRIEERHRGVRARTGGDRTESRRQRRPGVCREPVAQAERALGRRLRETTKLAEVENPSAATSPIVLLTVGP